ncbi:MAG: GNAT family N-acetyltransferase [Armatimonadetes bacterium]|nr:GNAT family N-acetyltransferase [Armatimonadota bacterium]
MVLRSYDAARDREAVHRIWREVGWVEKGKEERMDRYVGCGRALVAEVAGAAESLVTSVPGSLRYLDEELPFSAITGVTTSRVARQQGLATRLTALALAADAAEGALVSGLGMFEQGFYDRLGFGTGGYEHWLAVDPADIRVPVRHRVPRRLPREEWRAAHAARLARRRGHGGVNLIPPEVTESEMTAGDDDFGLGYADAPGGELTHGFWCRVKDSESGPYSIEWMAYRTREQLLELLALLHSLGDQVRLIEVREPPGILLQDLIARPLQRRQATEKSRFENKMTALAYWQMRICDLPACLARTGMPCGEVRFNLKLTDPVERLLDTDAPWRGVGGDYLVGLGRISGAERGHDPTLPTLAASVGAFTRLWLGVRPAAGLAATDHLTGPPGLLEALDGALRIPDPHPDWDF